MSNLIVYFYLFLVILFTVVLYVTLTEQFIKLFRKKDTAPSVSSGVKMRIAVANEIKKIAAEKNIKTVLDLGSGNGFLSKQIAKTNKNIKVIGFEHFITPFIYSKINNMFVKNVKIKRENFFNYLDKSDKKFDIGVAYLYPDLIARLEKYKHKFDIIILLDFNFKNTIESKKIKLNKNLLGQHNMFVYDFTKK